VSNIFHKVVKIIQVLSATQAEVISKGMNVLMSGCSGRKPCCISVECSRDDFNLAEDT